MNEMIGPKKGKTKQIGYVVVNLGNGKLERLHRLIWQSVYGPIPKGYEIHHRDGNKMNNEIANLSLLKHGDHTSFHSKNTTHTELWNRNISLANTGKKRSEETRRKISLIQTGKHLTEEHKRNISIGIKRHFGSREGSQYGVPE
jgi:hypothetical protein